MIKRHAPIAFVVLLMFSATAFALLWINNFGWVDDLGEVRKTPDAIKKKDYALALRELTPLSEKGDPEAQFWLGWMYLYGKGTKKDTQIAMKYFQKSANQGYADSQERLGYVYSMGSNVEKNLKEAIKWYRMAAEQGNDDAQYALGEAYIYGEERGVPLDSSQAEKWFLKAANQGHLFAQKSLGSMYSGGGALTWLGSVPIKHGNVSIDFIKAAKWYKKAIDQGFFAIDVAYELGAMYYSGMGVRQDDVQAYKWLLIHSDFYKKFKALTKLSEPLRKKLKKSLSSAQIAESQKLAEIWTEKHKGQ